MKTDGFVKLVTSLTNGHAFRHCPHRPAPPNCQDNYSLLRISDSILPHVF